MHFLKQPIQKHFLLSNLDTISFWYRLELNSKPFIQS